MITVITNGKKKMGKFAVEVEVVNYNDQARADNGDIDPAQVRRTTLQGVIDTGATRMVLPQAVAKALGLPIKTQKVKVRYADGRRAVRSEVGAVLLKLQGREDVFSAIVEPKRDTALIGAIVLEDLDFMVDCVKQRLVPRDPNFVVNEIE